SQTKAKMYAREAKIAEGSKRRQIISVVRRNAAAIEPTIADFCSGETNRRSTSGLLNRRAIKAAVVQAAAKNKHDACHGKHAERSEWETCADVRNSSAAPTQANATNFSR